MEKQTGNQEEPAIFDRHVYSRKHFKPELVGNNFLAIGYNPGHTILIDWDIEDWGTERQFIEEGSIEGSGFKIQPASIPRPMNKRLFNKVLKTRIDALSEIAEILDRSPELEELLGFAGPEAGPEHEDVDPDYKFMQYAGLNLNAKKLFDEYIVNLKGEGISAENLVGLANYEFLKEEFRRT